MRLRTWFLSGVALCLLPSFANDLISANDPQELLELITENSDVSATLQEDFVGDPMILVDYIDTTYAISFYGCENGSRCESITFSAAWENPGNFSLEIINYWNSNMRFSKAYLDSDEDPTLEWDVNLIHGVSKENLRDNLDTWHGNITVFQELLNEF